MKIGYVRTDRKISQKSVDFRRVFPPRENTGVQSNTLKFLLTVVRI